MKKTSPVKTYKDLGGQYGLHDRRVDARRHEIRKVAPAAIVQTFDNYADCFQASRMGASTR